MYKYMAIKVLTVDTYVDVFSWLHDHLFFCMILVLSSISIPIVG